MLAIYSKPMYITFGSHTAPTDTICYFNSLTLIDCAVKRHVDAYFQSQHTFSPRDLWTPIKLNQYVEYEIEWWVMVSSKHNIKKKLTICSSNSFLYFNIFLHCSFFMSSSYFFKTSSLLYLFNICHFFSSVSFCFRFLSLSIYLVLSSIRSSLIFLLNSNFSNSLASSLQQ